MPATVCTCTSPYKPGEEPEWVIPHLDRPECPAHAPGRDT